MMGSPTDEPGRTDQEIQHQVSLTKGYYMQTTEVTQGQWKEIMGDNPSYFLSCGKNCPVENISWNDVQDFIEKLNHKDNRRLYRLPTEAEWEYAARSGTTTPFAFGNCLSTNDANYNGNRPLSGCSTGIYRKSPITVATLKANAWGLYDMHGNVYEWCNDWYSSYPTSAVVDPLGPETGSYRMIRGGYWFVIARYCRSSFRIKESPDKKGYYLGCRLACSLNP
ncbi:serine/threonine protein kinase [Candidatus Magnetomorum sp. HK-1]|nr:serine/threonine protein kinase [Candidatus Magnetomorum sp. HK-1]